MNKKFVYQVGNNKTSYTMMHSQPDIKIWITVSSFLKFYYLLFTSDLMMAWW